LNVTLPDPWEPPKLEPAMTTDVPAAPVVGVTLLIAGVTANGTPLLVPLAVVTTTLPVVAAAGTVAVMLPALQAVAVAEVPLKVTVPDPCEAPKVEPAIATDDPTIPEFGVRLLMAGGTVKVTPLLAPLEVVTTRLPVVAPAGTVAVMRPALQAVTVAAVPLKVTVLVPCEAPKVEPAMTTDDPTIPEFGVRLLIAGVTLNVTPLLVFVPTVTVTLPVVAPAGTGTVIEPALQLVGVAAVPLNATELVP